MLELDYETAAQRIADKLDNDHAHKGYKTGFIVGYENARDAKKARPNDVKATKEDAHAYDSFWSGVFPGSSGRGIYKMYYKDGYDDGYIFYLEAVKAYFEGKKQGCTDGKTTGIQL